MERIRVRLAAVLAVVMAIALPVWPALATETGMSLDDSGAAPGASAPHIAVPGTATPRVPLNTNGTPAVSGAPLQGGLPPREVQPGEETPQLDPGTGGGTVSGIRRRGDTRAASGGDGTQTEDELYVGRKSGETPLSNTGPSPAESLPAGSTIPPVTGGKLGTPVPQVTERRPGAIVIPRENCGTFHTGWVDDPEADVNPCPAACERGERFSIDQQRVGDKTQYDAIYRCYMPEMVVNQRPAVARQIAAGGVKGTNCGTVWTAKLDDLNADVNPCYENCERGELLDVRRGKSYDGSSVSYEMMYRCYQAGTTNLVPDAESASSAQTESNQPAASSSVQPVSGQTQGAQVAGAGEKSSSQSGLLGVPASAQSKISSASGREINTAGIEAPASDPASTPEPPAAPAAPEVKGVTRWKTVVTSAHLPNGSRVGTTAACDNGRVVSGGWTEEGPRGKVTSSRPLADGSGFSGSGNAPFDPLAPSGNDVWVRAICIDRPAGYFVTQVSRTLQARERTLLEVSCPAGSAVIGGGASAPEDVYLAASAPRLDGGAWTALFRNDFLFGERVVEAYAVCADSNALDGREIVSTPTASLGNGAWQQMRLHCPVGKKALSLGYSSTATTITLGTLSWTAPGSSSIYAAETWDGAVQNTAGGFDNVLLDARLIAICVNASF